MKESKIMQMDWKALGYEKMYVNGKIRWVPQKDYKVLENKDTSSQ
jgi:hypothetical protein